MKKSLVALAALTACANVAHAQSSVTLYGIVDEGFNINTNAGGHHLYNLSSGVIQGSRFGFRGTEDLGSGLKALFVLENGFDVNTGRLGQGGLMFGRQAYVGLSSSYGTVTLGRQYDSVVDYLGILEVGDQWGGYIAAHPGDIDNFNNDYRANNTVKYTSATYGGLTFGGTYSFGGQAGNFTGNQIWSLGAGYSNGPIIAGVGYLNARQPAQANGLFGNNQSTGVASAVTTPIFSGYTSASTYQVIGTGAAYTFGSATLGATYSNTRLQNLGAVGTSAFRAGETAAFNNGEINFKYQLTPALLLGSAFTYTKSSGVTEANGTANPGAKYYQGSAGADYFLSKRTDVYFIGVYQKASGTDSTNKPAVAAISNLTPSSSDRQLAFRIGIRHKF